MVSSPSEQQRQHLQNELTRAVGTGRINIKQFDYLMGIVWSSDSMEVLQSIRRDYLGQAAQQYQPASPPVVRPNASKMPPPAPLKTTLGTIELNGDWRVPARQEFIINAGTLHIDLRQARADSLVTEFNITARMATVRIIAPVGVAFENRMTNNIASTFDVDHTDPHPNAPRVILTGTISGSVVKIRRVRRHDNWRKR